jgi:hypothetical protein
MHRDYYPQLTSFEDVAHHYLQERTSQVKAEMEWFGSQSLTLPEAIERACASICAGGFLHSHQRRPFQRWTQAPRKAADLLKPIANGMAAARNFDDELYPLICAELATVLGIGPLTRYDIAHRFGAWLRPKLEPIQVFLHRGTREGAKAVSVQVSRRESAPMSDFPEGLRQWLTAAQMEDALCIYRGTLARIAGNAQVQTTSDGVPRCVVAPAPPRALTPVRCQFSR